MIETFSPTIFFHVGLGKCGSSSIQAFLSENTESLQDSNAKYLGLNLEHADTIAYQWQKIDGYQLMVSTEGWQDQYISILSKEVENCRHSGVGSLIISNESIFGAYPSFSRIFSEIHNSANIVVILVFRRIHELAFTSYMQWCIKDKQRPGPLLSFGEWCDLPSDGIPWIHEELDLWLSDSLSSAVKLIHLEKSNDLIHDFCEAINIPSLNEINDSNTRPEIRLNVSDDRSTFFLRTLFQSLHESSSPPKKFDNFYQHITSAHLRPLQAKGTAHIAPTESDFLSFINQCDERVRMFNEVVSKHGLESSKMDSHDIKPCNIPSALSQPSNKEIFESMYQAMAILLNIGEIQSIQIKELKADIDLLRQKIDSARDDVSIH